MNAKTSAWIAKLLSAAGLLWCVGVGIVIWVTPIRSTGFGARAWSSSTSGDVSGNVSSGVQTVPVESVRRFADISLFGPLPLIVPVVLAAFGTWAAWRNRRLPLLLATAALLVFCFVTGFSIGRGYVLGGGALLWALLIRFAGEPERDLPTRSRRAM